MPRIEVTKPFAFAEKGIYVTEYEAGQIAEVSEECAECAIREGWAITEGEKTQQTPNTQAEKPKAAKATGKTKVREAK